MRTLKRCFMKGGLPAALALAWFASAALHAQGTAKKEGYESFHMLQTRNIFDPDRSRDAGTQPPRRTEQRASYTPPPPPPKPNDYVELTGVMTTDEDTFAFFAGSQPQFNKVVAVNGSIAGATITKITSAGIEVTREGRQIAVPVGRTVPLDDSEPGTPPGPGAATTAAAPVSTTSASTTSSPAVDPQAASQQVPVPDATSGSATPAGDNNISDAMRRMIERRQKELNQ